MIRFALVGCGRIAKRHSDLLGNKQIDGAKLVSVCDINYGRAKVIGDLYNVSTYSNMDKIKESYETLEEAIL